MCLGLMISQVGEVKAVGYIEVLVGGEQRVRREGSRQSTFVG